MKIYILGGGCFGREYARCLTEAKDKVNFEEIVVVDKNRKCRAAKDFEGQAAFIKADWTEFLAGYIKSAPHDTQDLLVVSHASPHLIGMAFIRLAQELTGKNIVLEDYIWPANLPFEKKLERGVRAISRADWVCPATCTELDTCQHLDAPRAWDLRGDIKNWMMKGNFNSFDIFSVCHLANGVSSINFYDIVNGWKSLEKKLSLTGEQNVGVATASACHGIICTFKVF